MSGEGRGEKVSGEEVSEEEVCKVSLNINTCHKNHSGVLFSRCVKYQ